MSILIKIDKNIQMAVDQYLIMHKEYKDLEKKLSKLREAIEQYMDDNNLESIKALTNEGIVILDSMERPIVTSRYTYYDMNPIISQIDESAKLKCLVTLIDKEALEALATLGEVSKSVLTYKVSNTIKRFSAKHRDE
jgi:hypothetical protein